MDAEARNIIDDFTREVSRYHGRSEGEGVGETDVHRLAQAWIQERSVNGILPHKEDLVQRIIAKVQRSQRILEEQSADSMGCSLESDKTRAVLVEAELERVQFLLRAYTRTRISKAEENIRKEEDAYDDGIFGESRLLTADERAYARARLQLVKSVFGESQRKGDIDDGDDDEDDEDEASMYDKTSQRGDQHVIVKDRSDRVQVARWKSVQQAVLSGEAELV